LEKSSVIRKELILIKNKLKMEDSNLENVEVAARPKFLQTLCILSFIGCGIMLLFGLFGLKNLFSTIEELAAEENMQMLQQMSQESYDNAIAALEYKDINAIFGVLTPALSLMAVIMMWNLKKAGYILYVFAEILPYALIAFTTGMSTFKSMGGAMENFQSVVYVVMALMVIFDIAFIIMYALNLKYMK
jgi:hypothetical protein